MRPAIVRISHGHGVGSGVIFEASNGKALIATNQHVVEGVLEVNTYVGTVRGVDPIRDIAVVTICCGAFHALPFANTSGNTVDVRVGDEIVAIGYAIGLPGAATVTRGAVSAVRFSDDLQSDVIQTEAAMNPGNSGGPILNLDGEILGINTFVYRRAQSGIALEGLNFAISASTVSPRVQVLRDQTPPTPAPTSTPPAVPGQIVFGPVGIDLRHRPDDEFYDWLLAGDLPPIVVPQIMRH